MDFAKLLENKKERQTESSLEEDESRKMVLNSKN